MTMKFTQVILENFGPYYGKQSLLFGTNRPIVIVHGDNMRGKTSFLNSIRWALYSRALDRFGQPMLYSHLINWEAVSEGKWLMSVTLRFQVDKHEYELIRQIQPKPTLLRLPPSQDSDFEEKVFLKKDGSYLNSDEVQNEVNRILPFQVSRFFLFDGELLNAYETLLSQTATQADEIKKSIEDILGVPALTNAILDLKQNHKEATRKQTSLAKQDQKAKVFAEKVAQLEKDIEMREKDLVSLEQQKEDYQRQEKNLEDGLQGIANLEKDIDNLSDIKLQIKNQEENYEKLKIEKREKLKDAWRDLISMAIKPLLTDQKEKKLQLDNMQIQIIQLDADIDKLRSLTTKGVCPTCGQIENSNLHSKYQSDLTRLQNERKLLQFVPETYNKLTTSIKRMEAIQQVGVYQAIEQIENNMKATRVQIYKLNRTKDEIEERLKNHDLSEIARNRRQLREVIGELKVIEINILDAKRLLEEKRQEESNYRSQMSKATGPQLQKLNQEIQIYQELTELFTQSVIHLRDELRRSVEKDASEIFLKLTTDRSYTGLSINDRYGLVILDDKGGEVQVRSAGAEQVVALSLIGALNKNAIRRGPIIMDTPFGRLDPKHRENILKFIPVMADQITLLVHGGEVDPTRDLLPIKNDIDREYIIDYVSSRHSNIIVKIGE